MLYILQGEILSWSHKGVKVLTIGNVYVTAKNYVDAIHYKHIFFLFVAFLFSSFIFSNILLLFFLHNFPFLGIIHKSSIL